MEANVYELFQLDDLAIVAHGRAKSSGCEPFQCVKFYFVRRMVKHLVRLGRQGFPFHRERLYRS